ncbi:MAG: hypothetical protein HPY44_20415 [Armatimonadetes bacterium]|nr:hypothetical protein [Armatimonadota bacterium]
MATKSAIIAMTLTVFLALAAGVAQAATVVVFEGKATEAQMTPWGNGKLTLGNNPKYQNGNTLQVETYGLQEGGRLTLEKPVDLTPYVKNARTSQITAYVQLGRTSFQQTRRGRSGRTGRRGRRGGGMPGMDMPGMGGMPGMPGMPGMEGPAPGMPGMPGGMPGMPGMEGPAPGMPGMPGGMPGMPGGMPGMPGGMPGMPGGMPGMPGGMPGMPGVGAAPDDNLPEYFAQLPGLPEGGGQAPARRPQPHEIGGPGGPPPAAAPAATVPGMPGGMPGMPGAMPGEMPGGMPGMPGMPGGMPGMPGGMPGIPGMPGGMPGEPGMMPGMAPGGMPGMMPGMSPGGMPGMGGTPGGFGGFGPSRPAKQLTSVRMLLITDKGQVDTGAFAVKSLKTEGGWSEATVKFSDMKGPGLTEGAKLLGIVFTGNSGGTYFVGRVQISGG